ncbi:glycosyltransferase family 2 protein [Pelagibacteraceae bacterium]|nr:glycosyltransferase family 2 protein [Pelagibacteraceae bacterium]
MLKKTSNCEIDIIVPNYNKALFLDECINSILNQTYKNWKLYIIDDCSSDNSFKIIEKYKNNNQIRIFKLRNNRGPSFCRNLGIRLSNSKFISFLDSDDYWINTKLDDQLNFMKQNNYDFTYSDYISFFENKNNKKKIKTNIKKSFTLKEFILNSSINSSTVILSRRIIGNIKFKKTKLLEDYLFKCELLRKNIKAYKYNSITTYYRILNNSRSNNKIKNMLSLWEINKHYNKLNFFENLKSIIFISLNSIKKYGLK